MGGGLEEEIPPSCPMGQTLKLDWLEQRKEGVVFESLTFSGREHNLALHFL